AELTAEQSEQGAISPGQCWVHAPVAPRPVREEVEVVVQEPSVRYSVTPPQLQEGVQQIVTRERVRTYRVIPATYKQVTEQDLVRPEIERSVVVPAAHEERRSEEHTSERQSREKRVGRLQL